MPAPESRDAGTLGALAGLLVAGLGLFALIAMVMPQLLRFLGFLSCFFFFGAFHYLVWGWWLKGALTEQPAEPPEDDSHDPH